MIRAGVSGMTLLRVRDDRPSTQPLGSEVFCSDARAAMSKSWACSVVL